MIVVKDVLWSLKVKLPCFSGTCRVAGEVGEVGLYVQGLPLQVETHLEQREQFSPWSWLPKWVSGSPNGKPYELLFSLFTVCCIPLRIFIQMLFTVFALSNIQKFNFMQNQLLLLACT